MTYYNNEHIKEYARQLYSQGFSYSQIEKIVKFPDSTIIRWCNEEYNKKCKEYSHSKGNENCRKYYKNNKDKIKERNRIAKNIKYKNNIEYKLASRLRIRMHKALKKGAKTGSAVRDLGCSIEQFKQYIESLWQSGMSWSNYGKNGWHLDHKIPLSYFDLTNRNEFLKASHYTNLQPMWAIDNIKKSNKLI